AKEPAALAQELLQHIYWHCLDRDALFQKDGSQQAAFLAALRTYLEELAETLIHSLKQGRPPGDVLDETFGDRRRQVDVTFAVGPGDEAVRVTGRLDYVFHDGRTGRHRLLDYKLTPAHEPAGDLFQAALYALMHHEMYQTRP